MATWNIRSAGRKLHDNLFQGITVKVVPPSAERVIDFQVSIILLCFIGLVFVSVITGVIFMASRLDRSGTHTQKINNELAASQANLDSVTDEVRNLLQTYDIFNTALNNAIREIVVTNKGIDPNSTDLLPEHIRDVPELSRSLASAIKPLQETMNVMKIQKKLLSDIPNVWPVAGGGELTMEFGPNIHPIDKNWYIHKGIDIAGSMGLYVVASANGRVIEAKYSAASGYGKTITIEHKYGFQTRYAHLGVMLVDEGTEVVQGQRIGTLGNTGKSTGAHVHFEIMLSNQVLDPVSFLKISNSFKRWTGDRVYTYE